MRVIICFLLFVFCFFYSCNNEKKKTASTLDELYGKKIEFFNENVFFINAQKTILSQENDFDYTIVMYGHPSGCETCTWKLDEWYLKRKEILHYNKNVNFKFILQTENYDDIGHYVVHSMPDIPLIYDSYGLFIKKNNLPTEKKYHTFLLNKKNEIILVGSPITNDKLWEMYKKIIIN